MFTVSPENCSTCGMNIPAEDKDCLVKQYGNYSLKGHSINGSFTLLENLADTEGLAIAYQVSESNHIEKLTRASLSNKLTSFAIDKLVPILA